MALWRLRMGCNTTLRTDLRQSPPCYIFVVFALGSHWDKGCCDITIQNYGSENNRSVLFSQKQQASRQRHKTRIALFLSIPNLSCNLFI